MTPPTHDFILSQGGRRNDTIFISRTQHDSHSTPTQHGHYLMRSRLETLWAARFERRGFVQAIPGVTTPPCYFYEPAGSKRWPTYRKGHHYRIDFALVYEVDNRVITEDAGRAQYGLCSCAVRWEWVSIKPTIDDQDDRQHLSDLVMFDSRHQRAFQCCGLPDHPLHIYQITYNPITGCCDVS